MPLAFHSDAPLAVVGMSCRLPGAADLTEYWRLIESGGDATRELPREIFDRELYYDPRKGARGKSYTAVGGVCPRLPFDNCKCRLPENEIRTYDPAHLTMGELAHDALCDAGYDPFDLPIRNAGVYFGHTCGSELSADLAIAAYVEEVARYVHDLESLRSFSPPDREEIARRMVAWARQRYDRRRENDGLDLAASRGAQLIARAFGLDGPCLVVDAACASSLLATMLGARALQHGAIDMAVVGGASYLKCAALVLFSAAQSVADGKSRPFDANATGLITSEGYVTLVLKTLPKALADGDRIRGVIRRISFSADGHGKSLWAPLKNGQVLAMRRAYRDGIGPEDLQYIEAHATSTQVGDATELAALAEVFPAALPGGRKIALGSVKANLGHTLETAGAASLAKVILAMEHGVIPPVANLTTPNPAIPWDRLPFYLPRQAERWERPQGDRRRAAVNSFGIGGLNIHIVLEEHLPEEPPSHFVPALPKGEAPAVAAGEPIAVIGTGAILPGAHTVEAFLELLSDGRDPKSDVTPDQWDPEVFYSAEGPRPYCSPTKRGGFIAGYHYDWRRHRVPPKQVEKANPLQFMLLDATEQALRQAGYLEKGLDRDRVGVVVGTQFGGDFSNQLQVGLRLPEFERQLRTLLQARGVTETQMELAVAEFVKRVLQRMPALLDETGSFTNSTLASRITKAFDLKGGGLSLDAGWGSGLAALGACVDVLRGGDCDLMLCAAGQRHMDVALFENMQRTGELALGDPAPAYDEQSNGCVPGEGCVVLLLKRLSDAQRDGNRVLAVVREVAASADFNCPGNSLRTAMRRAMDAAGTSAEEVLAVEAVGTVPSLEMCEVAAVQEVAATADRREPVLINSLASQFGMMGAAHGLAGVAKAAGAVASGRLPAGAATKNPRRSLFASAKVRPQQVNVPLNPETASLMVLCGRSRGVSHAALIESARKASRPKVLPMRKPAAAVRAGAHIVRLGAADFASLAESLRAASPAELFQANERFRQSDRARLAIVCQSVDELTVRQRQAAEALGNRNAETCHRLATEGVFFGEVPSNRCAVAFVFPGQGSQRAGMLTNLIAELPEAAQACREADAAMLALGHPPFAQIVGPDAAELGVDVWKTQVAMLLADYVVYRSLDSLGLTPDVVAGHSYGEYPALVAAGAWSITDAIRCTRHRAKAIAEVPGLEGCMAATNAPPALIEESIALLGGAVYLANYNAPEQTVISGRCKDVESVMVRLKQAGHSVAKLNVPYPFHSPLMRPSVDRLASTLPDIPLRASEVPVIGTTSCRPMTRPEEFVRSLLDQFVTPVNYPAVLAQLIEFHPALVVEVGPQQVLTKLNWLNHEGGGPVFMAADNPRRPGAAALLGVLAQADCLGCLHREVSTPPPQPRTPREGRILVIDATERRREKMRQSSLAPAREATQPPEDDNESRSRKETSTDEIRQQPSAPVQESPRAVLPLEQPPPDDAPAAADADELHKILVDFVVEQTGYPEEIVELDADLEADLGIDSIKKAQLFGELGDRFRIVPRADLSLDDFPTLHHVLNFLVAELGSPMAVESLPAPPPPAVIEEPAAVPMITLPDDVPAAVDADELRKILVEFVVEQTGYPEEIVELDADLEADLGIDSIKKAQLFGELGDRFRIVPRADLSLDDFPTLRHVLNFLVAELDSPTAGESLPAPPPAEAVAEPAITPQRLSSSGAVRVEVLEGTPREMGLQHGRALAAEIHREITGLVDATDARTSRNGELWQAATLEELHGLADGAGINGEAVESWNFVLEPFSAWRTSFGIGGNVDPRALSSDSTTVVQVRRPVGGLPYLLVAKAGQLLPRAGVNAAGVAVSWEPLESDPPPSDIVVLTEAIHNTLNTSRAHREAHARLQNIAVRGRWCVGVGRSGETAETYFRLDEHGIALSPPEGASPQQREFHRQMQEEPATLVLWDWQTGSSTALWLPDLLPPVAEYRLPQPEAPAEPAFQPLRPEESRMQRHVLRMTVAPLAAGGQSVYRPGDLVCAIGPSALAEPLRRVWEQLGCRTVLLTDGDWAARFQRLVADEVPRHLLLLHEAAGPAAELDRFRAADRFVEILEATRQWVEVLEHRVGVDGCSLVGLTRMGGDFGFHSLKGGFSGGGLTGLFKAIRHEFAALSAKVLDFDSDCPPDEIARCLAHEMAGGSTELEVGFRRGRRYVVQAVAQPVGETSREIPRGSVWVVTGGGRGVTAAVARELGRRYGVKLHLLGTAAAPRDDAPWRGRGEAELKELKREVASRARQEGKAPAEEWQRLERAMELDNNLRRLREERIQARYHCCDVADLASLDATLREIRRTDGPIEGVIHGAGVEAACRFVRKQPSSVRRCIAVKCGGAANLTALTRPDPLRFFVGFGSTSGRFGGVGQADYSLASDLLAKMVGRLAVERPDCRCVCFHWPAWDEVGMAVRPESKSVLQRAGIAFMPVREGAAHLIGELLAGGEEREILVFDRSGLLDIDGVMIRSTSSEDPAAFRAASAALPPRIVAQPKADASLDCSAMGLIQSLSPDTGSDRYVATVLLDPTKDPFLIHHRFRDTPFLPAVISMEIFAEAVGAIEPRATLLGLSDVRLVNGLALPASRPYEARIVIERCPEGYRCRLVGPFINGRGQVVEQERLYASALVELGEAPPRIEPRDPGEPVLDWFPTVYRSDIAIVHGPPLQACRAMVYQRDGARAKIRGAAPAELMGRRAADRLLLPCAEIDGSLFVCGAYTYCMLERVLEIPAAVARYRQARLPRPGEDCVLRVFYRESSDRGSEFDFYLVGAAKDPIFEVQGFQTFRVRV